ncbi:hypothetical protein K457DRAFT_138752 [Linnemannia elongata AG-77]|uniref:F-box domain-containing protein n=1 Tax=Linnemannia elongata AG-77 TaxID=1314771 RepID=A0A197JSM9_9FUNG|nr:hypothetical protein K457DRAFT_138752 [Linnemannia elongata AG-77]
MFNNQPLPEDVVRLPEIVALLGPYLKAPDLFACIQVCHLWNHLLTPWLWRSIDDSEYSWPTILSNHKNPESQGDKDADWIRAIFAKYGHHIRELTSQWGVILEVANTSGTCNHLESLRIGDLSTSKTRDDDANNSGSNAGANGVPVHRYDGPGPDRHREAATGPLLSPIFEGILEPHQAQHRTVARQELDWATAQHFWLLVRQNTQSLFSLRLDASLDWLCVTTNVDFVFDTLASLVNLVNLENDMLPLNPNILLERLPGLLSYRTRLRFLHDNDSLTRSFSQLIYLEIWGSVPTQTFFTLLKYLPNLETLRMDEFRGVFDFTLEGHLILENTPSRLKTLRFRNPSARVDEQIANLVIPWIPHLTEISLTQLHPATARALGTHCRKLEVVKQIDGSMTIYQDNIHRKPLVNTVGILLRECATLRVFDGIHHTLEASHILKYPWACRDLQTFRCQIIGIPRLTIAEQEFLDSTDDEPQLTDSNNSNDSDSITNNVARKAALFKKKQDSLDVQLQVMDHLAGLTSLTVLDLGYEYRDLAAAQYKKELEPNWTVKIEEGEPTLDSLELTLATGLDRLSSLTRLEIFGFEGVNHRIGKQELSWMATAWPKLKVLRGLHEDDLPGVVEDPERTRLREFMRELRVDVRHATLRPKVKF